MLVPAVKLLSTCEPPVALFVCIMCPLLQSWPLTPAMHPSPTEAGHFFTFLCVLGASSLAISSLFRVIAAGSEAPKGLRWTQGLAAGPARQGSHAQSLGPGSS
jgi:hypothetical protein